MVAQSDFEHAVEQLKQGRAVIFPTDTVYGLGVAVRYAESPDEIFDIKQRDHGKPVAWLVSGVEALDEYGLGVSAEARRLARSFWPGALTLIVKASPNVPAAFQSKRGTIGLRMPANDVALRLVGEVGPIAASSANPSGGDDPVAFAEVDTGLLSRVSCYLEDERPGSGVASTVLDCSQGGVEVVRQGDIMTGSVITVPLDFKSHDGKTQVNAKLWTRTEFGDGFQPASEKPRAVIQLVHGMAEHIDRYDDFASYLVGRGFVVCAEDHIGHGGSAVDETEFGHMPAHGGKDILLGDVHTLRRMVAELYPDVPYVIYGHSMGSFIVRAYIARHGEGIAACVLSGTGNVPAPLSKFGRSLARMLAAIRGERHRSPFIDNMGAGGYGKKIENPRTHLDWLSTDDAVVDAYIEDEKCGFMFTVGGYATLLDLTAEVVTPECAEKVPKELPVLFVAGDGDPVGDMGKGVQAAAKLLRDAGVREVDCKLYEGMRHEIHNEVDNDRVYDDIATWIEGRAS